MPEPAVRHGFRGLLQGPDRGGEHHVGGGVGGRGLPVGVQPRSDRVQDVALGDDAEPAGVRIMDDSCPDTAGRHQSGRLTERMGGADGEDHRAHGVTDEHETSHLLGEPTL